MDSASGKRPIGELLRAMATGSEADFVDFVGGALPDLERTLRGLFRRHGAVANSIDDLIQDTMLKVIETLRRNPTQKVSIAWLFMVARSVRIDRARREQRESAGGIGLLAHLPIQSDPDECGYDFDLLLSKLKEDHKIILRMIYYDSMNLDQIAATLNIAKEAAYKRHARALQKLRDIAE